MEHEKSEEEVLESYGSKRVVLGDYITSSNQGFTFKGVAYISTNDEDLFFCCADGALLEINTEDCPFNWDAKVFPVNVMFSIETPKKYLKEIK